MEGATTERRIELEAIAYSAAPGGLSVEQAAILGELFFEEPTLSPKIIEARSMLLEILQKSRLDAELYGQLRLDPSSVGVLSERVLALSDEDFVAFEAILLTDFANSKDGLNLRLIDLLADSLGPAGAADGTTEAMTRTGGWGANGAIAVSAALLAHDGIRGLGAITANGFNWARWTRAAEPAGDVGRCSAWLARALTAKNRVLEVAEKAARKVAWKPKPGTNPPSRSWIARKGRSAAVYVGRWGGAMLLGGAAGAGLERVYEISLDPKIKGSPHEALMALKVVMAADLLADIEILETKGESDSQQFDCKRPAGPALVNLSRCSVQYFMVQIPPKTDLRQRRLALRLCNGPG